jgi:NADH-quinone oxidoreductase subunit D
MGEIPIPVAEIYPCRRRKWRLGFYLVIVLRIDYILEDLVLFTIKPTRHDKKGVLSDAIVILSSLNVIAGELDVILSD